jgi:two-component system cell cycle sensor histidine kinase PleC
VAVALQREKTRELSLSPAVLEAMPLPVVVADRAGAMIACNQPFLNLCSFDRSDCPPGAAVGELARRHATVEPLRLVAAALAGAGGGADRGQAELSVARTDLADGTVVLTVANARAAAEAHGRNKAAFLASMSHELRTPLNAVIGFADIIKEQLFGPIGSEKYIEYADEIRTSGHGLLSIINNIIDLSRIAAGQFKLREEETDLADLAQGAARRFAEAAAAANVTIRLDRPAEFPLVRVDPRALQQALGNILSNAVKFTPPGGTVGIGLARIEGGVELAVTDTGGGIPAEHLARLGEAFLQADDVLVRSHQGAGLGLALAKALVSLLGGRLSIASAEGKGTRVAIVLPAYRVVEAGETVA